MKNWTLQIREILKRHDIGDPGAEPVAGFNSTYPTFVCGDVVVKLFTGFDAWRESFEAERAALTLVNADPDIAAPHLLAKGAAPHPYLVTGRVPGISWREAGLSPDQKRAVAAQMGRQIRRVHALRPDGIPELPSLNVAAAAEQSSLPSHLVAQVDDYLAGLGPPDPVFIHGDLVAAHAFVERDRLTGIIDWGDAVVADRHFEIIQIHRDLFECDKDLLRVFLDACEWPLDRDFPRKAMGMALIRQAAGLARHRSMDVFEPVAERFPLKDIATLDDLAAELFEVQ